MIHISRPERSGLHTPSDVLLRAGDSVYIPKKPNFVMVQGAVYNQTAISFRGGEDRQAGTCIRPAGQPRPATRRVFLLFARTGRLPAGRGGCSAEVRWSPPCFPET